MIKVFLSEFIKETIFSVYAFFFNLGARIGVKENRVGLVSMHNAHFKDGLYEMERAVIQGRRVRALHEPCFLKISREDLKSPIGAFKFVTLDAFRLGRCKYIFLNDNFMPLSKARPSADTTVVQLWHGMGAFKKFGFDVEVPRGVRRREAAANKRLSFVVCSSNGVRDIYANAFGVPYEKVLAAGAPDGDYYFRKESFTAAREHVYAAYSELRDKYVVLYAPTFRDGKDDAEILRSFDPAAVKSAVEKWLSNKENTLQKKEVAVVTRLHPQVHGTAGFEGCIDATDYDDARELCMVADLLITDYSSICMDFVLQDKPTVFYAFDLDFYKGARDFYFDYSSYVPGPIARSMEELEEILSNGSPLNPEFTEKSKQFKQFNFDTPDGDSAKRVLEMI